MTSQNKTLLLVLAVTGGALLLAGGLAFVGWWVFISPDGPGLAPGRMLADQNVKLARAKAKKLDLPLQAYYLRHNEYPPDLAVLTQPDPDNNNLAWITEEDLLDPWDQEYQYAWPGVNNKAKPDIWTVNPDNNEQIGNWGK